VSDRMRRSRDGCPDCHFQKHPPGLASFWMGAPLTHHHLVHSHLGDFRPRAGDPSPYAETVIDSWKDDDFDRFWSHGGPRGRDSDVPKQMLEATRMEVGGDGKVSRLGLIVESCGYDFVFVAVYSQSPLLDSRL
jgi:hypothetical protein